MSLRQPNISDLRVGIITFAALTLLVLGVILSGGNKGVFFQETTSMKAVFYDVGGLKKGAAVSLGGMNVGMVTGLDYGTLNNKSVIEVSMEIRQDVRHLIKEDSMPTIRTAGMLGDRYVNIMLGSQDSPTQTDVEPMIGEDAADFDATLRQTYATLSKAHKTLDAIISKEGTMGELFYSRELYEMILGITQEIFNLVQDFKENPRKYVKLELF